VIHKIFIVRFNNWLKKQKFKLILRTEETTGKFG